MKTKMILSLVIALSSTQAFAAKGYQVTGPVLDVTATSITVQKGKDKWEIAVDPSTKSVPGVKKGDQVTVYYTMTATDIEAKAAKALKKK